MILTLFSDGILEDDTQGQICYGDACKWPHWGSAQVILGRFTNYYIYVGY